MKHQIKAQNAVKVNYVQAKADRVEMSACILEVVRYIVVESDCKIDHEIKHQLDDSINGGIIWDEGCLNKHLTCKVTSSKCYKR